MASVFVKDYAREEAGMAAYSTLVVLCMRKSLRKRGLETALSDPELVIVSFYFSFLKKQTGRN